MKRNIRKALCLLLVLVSVLVMFGGCFDSQPSKPNPAYDEFLQKYGIEDHVHATGNFTAFAGADDDDDPFIYEMGYKGDIIVTMIDTYYVKVEGLTEENVEAYKKDVMEAYADYKEIPGATVDLKVDVKESTAVLTIKVINLDNKDVVKKAEEVGYLGDGTETPGEGFYSLRKSRTDLIADGMIERYID